MMAQFLSFLLFLRDKTYSTHTLAILYPYSKHTLGILKQYGTSMAKVRVNAQKCDFDDRNLFICDTMTVTTFYTKTFDKIRGFWGEIRAKSQKS